MKYLLIGTLLLCSMALAAEPAADTEKQFLGILRLQAKYFSDVAWTDEAKEAVQRHFVRLQEAAKNGKVILAGRTLEPGEQTMGLVIFKAKDLKEAESFMAEDPAVVAGVMKAEVHPYQVAVLGK
jgi:uncharacterized protein YciI